MLQNKDHPESGNVFLFILLGVVLFAALAFTVSRGFQSSTTSNLSKREAELAASEIINYAQRIERTVNRLRRNGCSENDLSFQYDEDNDGDFNDNDESYHNTNSPTDHSCHIFHPDGGKMSWQFSQINWFDSALSGNIGYGNWFLTSLVRIIDVGENCSNGPCQELIIALPYLDETLCRQVNRNLNISDIPQDISSSLAYSDLQKFTGEFSDDLIIQNPAGESTACFEGDVNPPAGTFHFYHVLIAR